MIDYLRAHPRPGCYMRALPVSVPTKFIEQHLAGIEALLTVHPESGYRIDGGTAAERLGFAEDEPAIRGRFLCPRLREQCRFPTDDLELRISTWTARAIPAEIRVVACENKTNFLALPPLDRTLALWGAGGAATGHFPKLGWLRDLVFVYWGDLDPSGFAILASVRSHFPHVRSAMMDVATLESHRAAIGKAKPSRHPVSLQRDFFPTARNRTGEAAVSRRTPSHRGRVLAWETSSILTPTARANGSSSWNASPIGVAGCGGRISRNASGSPFRKLPPILPPTTRRTPMPYVTIPVPSATKVPDMRCVLGSPELADGLALLHGFTATVTTAHIDLPNRSAPPAILREVLRAAGARVPINIYDYSVHSNRESWRAIVPRAFAHDGYRWHVRAWCTEDNSYKDFVLGRIARTKAANMAVAPTADDEWETFVTLRLRPHRSLGTAQRKAVEHDFGMKSGVCALKVRKAMLGYTMAYLGVSATERPKLLELAGE